MKLYELVNLMWDKDYTVFLFDARDDYITHSTANEIPAQFLACEIDSINVAADRDSLDSFKDGMYMIRLRYNVN